MAQQVNPTHHIGVVVRNLERSLEFYRDALGIEIIRGRTTFSDRDMEGIARAAGAPGYKIAVAFLSTGNTMIELVEYDPPGKDFTLSSSDVGAPHFCIEVDDIEAVHSRLAEKGVEFYAPPYRIQDGYASGVQFTYLRDPDGISLELIGNVVPVEEST